MIQPQKLVLTLSAENYQRKQKPMKNYEALKIFWTNFNLELYLKILEQRRSLTNTK